MLYTRRTDHIGWKFAGIVTLFLALLILLFRVGELGAQEDPQYDVHGKAILYLASNSLTEADPFLESSELASRNVVIVHDFAELQDLRENHLEVGAIVINGSRVDDLDTKWIQDVYAQETVVAGLNITITDLAEIVGDKAVAQDSAWTDGWQQEPFFSMLSYKLTGTAEEQERANNEGVFLGMASRNTDNIVDGDFGLFFHLIDMAITVLGEEQ